MYTSVHMNSKAMRWVLTFVLAALAVFCFVGETPTIGVSWGWTDGRYHFEAGTTPVAIVVALVMTGLYILLMCAPPSVVGEPLPGLFRRFVSFWCDFVFGMVAIAPFLGLVAVAIEWGRTGVFAWQVVRTVPALSDAVLVVTEVLCCAAVLVLHFALPLIFRKPSPGSCISGYQVVPEGGAKMTFETAVLRSLLGFIAVASWYVAPFAGRDRKNGKFWLDRVFRTQAVKLG